MAAFPIGRQKMTRMARDFISVLNVQIPSWIIRTGYHPRHQLDAIGRNARGAQLSTQKFDG